MKNSLIRPKENINFSVIDEYLQSNFKSDTPNFFHAFGSEEDKTIVLPHNKYLMKYLDIQRKNGKCKITLAEDNWINLPKNGVYFIQSSVSIDWYHEDYMNAIQYRIIDNNGNYYGSTGISAVSYSDANAITIIETPKLSGVCINVEIVGNDNSKNLRFHPSTSWIRIEEFSSAEAQNG